MWTRSSPPWARPRKLIYEYGISAVRAVLGEGNVQIGMMQYYLETWRERRQEELLNTVCVARPTGRTPGRITRLPRNPDLSRCVSLVRKHANPG